MVRRESIIDAISLFGIHQGCLLQSHKPMAVTHAKNIASSVELQENLIRIRFCIGIFLNYDPADRFILTLPAIRQDKGLLISAGKEITSSLINVFLLRHTP